MSTETKEIFDFPFERVPLLARVGEEELKTDRDCIVRTDTNEVIGYVSSSEGQKLTVDGDIIVKPKNYYKVVPHVDVVSKAREVINAIAATDLNMSGFTEKTTLTNNGARLYHEFNFPNYQIAVDRKDVAVGDYINMKVVLTNSYDLSRKAGFEVGGIRKVCANGLMLFKTAFFNMYKHTGGFDIDRAAEELNDGISTFKIDLVEQVNTMANIPITYEDGVVLVEELTKDKVLPEKYASAVQAVWSSPENANRVIPVYDAEGKIIENEFTHVMDTFELDRARTLWTLYNAFTLILTHMVVSYERRLVMYEALKKRMAKFKN